MRLKPAQQTALVYLLSLTFLSWGFAIGKFEAFPHDQLMNIWEFVKGHDLEPKTSVFDKVVSDLDIEPRRFLRVYKPHAIKDAKSVDLPGKNSRRENPLCYIKSKDETGYYALFGCMDFKRRLWGGLLMDGTGKVIHTWDLSTDSRATNPGQNLYGLALFGDGSVIYISQVENRIVKVDAESREVWELPGGFHHTISPTEDGHFWTFTGKVGDPYQDISKISIETGKITQEVNMMEVRKQNPHHQYFILRSDDNPLLSPQTAAEDTETLHGNDIDPLAESMASQFAMFEAGDLLISYRSINLVFVLDPDTSKIKWWRVGAWDRQHDPDWEEDGTFAVFSNNTASYRKFSDIISIDPKTMKHRAIVDGQKHRFASEVNGRHQRTDFGTRIITCSSRGWVFEVNDSDEVVFSFVNNYNQKEHVSLHMSDAYHVREDFFTDEFLKSCAP